VRAPILSLLGRLSGRLSDAVIAPSRTTATELARDYGIREIKVLPNGIAPPRLEAPRFERASSAAVANDDAAAGRQEPPVVLFVGRLRTRKAVAVLLEAVALLEARGVDLVLRVIGSGEQEEALAEHRATLGLTSRVELSGAVPHDVIPEIYAAAAVFCLPSTYEGFPLAILEAMAVGLPVVSTTVSGIPEAVEHERTGLLVEPEDAAALADALGRLLTDVELRAEMGQRGKQRYLERFTIERVAALHFAFFEALIADADRPRIESEKGA